MDIGDIVIVVRSLSIPEQFLGQYGKVTSVYGGKVNVELFSKIGTRGSLSHTSYPNDLLRIGKVFDIDTTA
jgi:hypothetical protein